MKKLERTSSMEKRLLGAGTWPMLSKTCLNYDNGFNMGFETCVFAETTAGFQEIVTNNYNNSKSPMFGGKKYFGLRGTSLNIAIGLVAGTDFLLFGYDQGVMGGLLTLGSFVKIFPQMDTRSSVPAAQRSHNSTIQGTAVAMYTIGCFFGALTCMFVGDHLGRRKTLFIGASIMTVGAILQATAFSLSHFIVARIVTGFGCGLNTATVPVWQSECSKPHRRGQLILTFCTGSLITGGVMLSYWLDFGFSFLEPSEISWRFPIAFQIVFCVIVMIFIFPLPESPRWLVLKGRTEEALEVLSALDDAPTDDPRVLEGLREIQETLTQTEDASIRDLFTMDENRNFHRTALAFLTQMFQQISGINLITFYAATIYENYIGLSPFISRILAACNGTEYFIASWIAVVIIERVGRRKLMLFGAAGLTGSMVILAVMAKIGGSGPGIVAATFLFIFNTFFAIGWLGIPWLYPAEITPLRIRAKANSVSTSANWIFNFLVVMITPIAFDNIGYKTYVIFAVINFFICPVVYLFYPETAYRSLEEMDGIFHKTASVWDVVGVAEREPRKHGRRGELLLDAETVKEGRTVVEHKE
ncbi:hypothetical protein RUND412_002713 [Rhizina undulata]